MDGLDLLLALETIPNRALDGFFCAVTYLGSEEAYLGLIIMRFGKQHRGRPVSALRQRGWPANSRCQACPASSNPWFLPTNAVRREESLHPTTNIIAPNRANKAPQFCIRG